MNFRNYLKITYLLSFFLMSNLINAQSGIKIRPNSVVNSARATDIPFSYDTNETTKTNITSLGIASGHIALKHNTVIPAGTKYYIKINNSDAGSFFDYLLGGYVGSTLSDILGFVIGGNHFTSLEVYEPNTSSYINDTSHLANVTNKIFSASLDQTYTNNANIKLLSTSDGNYLLTLTPSADYQFIKILDNNPTILPSSIPWTDIYDAYYYENNVLPECFPTYTSFETTNNLLSVVPSKAPIKNANHAIDNDPLNTFSQLGSSQLLAVELGSKIEQFFHPPGAISNKKLQIRLQIPSSLLKVGVGSGISVVFYNNDIPYPAKAIDRSILDVDLLGLVNIENGQPFSITIDPPTALDSNGNITGFLPYDKVGIKVEKPINVDVATVSGNLNIYDVAFVDLEPENRVVCTKTFEIAGGGYEKKFDITQLISGFDPAKFTQYHIVDDKHRLVKFDSRADIDTKKWQPLGQYLIKGIDAANFCIDQYYTYIAVQDNQYTISGKAGQTVLVNNELDFSKLVYTSNLPNSGAAQIYDESNNQIVTNSKKVFDKLGTFNYYVKVTNNSGTCDIIKRIKVYVYDTLTCDYRYVKRHAISEDVGTASLLGIPLGGSSESERAVDADFSTNSTIFNVISLLGIGTTWQDLKFSTTITAGTPVTIKLGQEYSVLQLIGAITIRPLDAQGNAIGKLKGIGETDLLNALVGDNVFEFSFTPTDNNGVPIDYSGVRVHLGSLLGVGNSMSIYGAYVDERLAATSSTCVSNLEVNGATIPKILNVDTYLANTDTNVPGFDVLTAVGSLDGKVKLNSTTQDVLWGVKDPGIGVATSLSGVIYPYLAADHSYETVDINNNPITVDGLKSFAIFNTAAAVLNAQTLTVKFKEIARPGDKVRIVMGSQNVGVLNLDLLKNFTIQRYLGDVPVGDVITNSQFSIINLNILGLLGDVKNKYAVIIDDSKVPFDRIELKYTNLVSVQLLGNYTYVYDISLIPYLEFGDNQTDVNICLDKVFEVEKSEMCTQYGLSFAYKKLVDGSPLSDPVYEWIEIPASQLNLVYENQEIYRYKIPNVSQLKSIFETHLNESIDNINGNLYIKVLTTRQGCLFGEAQYLKVNSIGRCNGMISNPMIRTRLKSY